MEYLGGLYRGDCEGQHANLKKVDLLHDYGMRFGHYTIMVVGRGLAITL